MSGKHEHSKQNLSHCLKCLANVMRYIPVKYFESCPLHPESVATSQETCSYCIIENEQCAHSTIIDDVICTSAAADIDTSVPLSEEFMRYIEPKIYYPKLGALKNTGIKKSKKRYSNAFRLSTYPSRIRHPK